MVRDFWDSQLKFSEVIPEFPEFIDAMGAESRKFSDNHNIVRHNYGESNRQWFETIEGTGRSDILPVFVHGGFWRALRADDHRCFMRPLLAISSSVANIEYRLIDETRMAGIVKDVRTALESIADQNPNMALLPIGHSAGAHLVVSALSDSSVSQKCKGVIALSGVFDLRPITSSFLQDELCLTDSEVDQFSHYSNPLEIPVLFVTGADETFEMKRQSAILSATELSEWRQYGNANHMTLLYLALQDIDEMIGRLKILNGRL